MLSFKDFFITCAGTWTTERTYHFVTESRLERSYTEYQVQPLTAADKKQILLLSETATLQLQVAKNDFSALIEDQDNLPGFAIAFNTRSETGETVAMSLQALFVADSLVVASTTTGSAPLLPIAAQIST
ncbi:phycobiliprotein lyase [Trichocoleus sp. FACHB-591]|uniref:phycobiliprotein lyase n=1 Tax=Trichocoleus sp. FACHB-591 TaxID=2692872 RepID=UPI0021084CAB|nr:phycobiliprotein lyase [Trichocoleus sp. FACHB-591]